MLIDNYLVTGLFESRVNEREFFPRIDLVLFFKDNEKQELASDSERG